jgi:hypothetical protein
MANLPRRKTYGSVNLAFLEPVERLDPDQLKKFSKEELSAYLLYYGMGQSSSPQLSLKAAKSRSFSRPTFNLSLHPVWTF